MLVSPLKNIPKAVKTSIILITAVILLPLVIAIIFISIYSFTATDPIIDSLPNCKNKQVYTYGVFQDYTDYGIYNYSNIDISVLESNGYFQPVDTELPNVLSYIENYEKWIESHRRVNPDHELPVNYKFDKAIIDEEDYFYVTTKEGTPIGNGTYGKFDNYTLYLFDTQTKTLYYFHNNI